MLNYRNHLNCGQQHEQLQSVFFTFKHRQSAQHRFGYRLRTRMNDIHDVFNKRAYDTTGLRLWFTCFEGTWKELLHSSRMLTQHSWFADYRLSPEVANCIEVRSSAGLFVYLATIRIATHRSIHGTYATGPRLQR